MDPTDARRLSTTATVYCISHSDRCEVYVGKTLRMSKRMSAHRRASASASENSMLYSWWRSLPSPPDFTVLDQMEFSSASQADAWALAREVEVISLLRGCGMDLLNADGGGRGGRRPTEYTRAKLRAAQQRRVASTPREKFVEAALRSSASKSPEQKSAAARAGMMKRSHDDRVDMARRSNAKITPEARRAATIKANITRGAEGRSSVARKGNARLTLEQRREKSRRGQAKRTAEERSASTRRGWITRRENAGGSY